jgi:hypothetical protein
MPETVSSNSGLAHEEIAKNKYLPEIIWLANEKRKCEQEISSITKQNINAARKAQCSKLFIIVIK